jgi:hypothetical protein
MRLFSKRIIHTFSIQLAPIDSMVSPSRQSLPRIPCTKRDFNILALDACRSNIIRLKEASLGVSLLTLCPNVRPICKALPAELMVTLRAYQNYSTIEPCELAGMEPYMSYENKPPLSGSRLDSQDKVSYLS